MIPILSLLAGLASSLPEPILHLRADSGVVLDSKGAVRSWKDLSPRGTHFGTVASNGIVDSAKRPVATTSGLQGRPSVRFLGRHVLADTTSLPLDSGFTLFFVARDSNPDALSAFLNKGKSDLSVDLWGQDAGNFQISQAWVVGIAKTSFQTSSPMLYEASWNGSQAKLYVAGRLEAKGTANPALVRNKTTWLGGAFADSRWQGLFDGHVGEVLVYPGVLADSIRWRVEDRLLSEWSIHRLGRASSPDGPGDSTELLVHLRADSGLLLDSQKRVIQWTSLAARKSLFRPIDNSGKIQTALAPTVTSSGLSNLPSVRFSGSNALCDTSGLPLDSGFTLFFVAQDSNPTAMSAFLNKGPNDLSVDLWEQSAGYFNISHAWVVGLAKTSFLSVAPQLYVASWSRDTARLFVSGKTEAKAHAILSDLVRAKRTWLAGVYYVDFDRVDYFFKGHVGELRLYKGYVGDALRGSIEDAMMAEWSIPSRRDPVSSGRRSGPAGSLERTPQAWILRDPIAREAILYGLDGTLLSRTRFLLGVATVPLHTGSAVLVLRQPDGSLTRRILSGVR